MAKPTNTPAPSPVQPPAGAIVQSQGTIDAVHTAAGRVPSGLVVDAFDAEVSKLLSSADLLKLLDTATAAKADAFGEVEKDFWKPAEEGQPKFIQGIYMGADKSNRIMQHAFAVKGKDGKPLLMRCNGGHILTNELKKCSVGNAVRVEYKGQEMTGNSRPIGKWTVSVLK